ncbi:hypothetical protein LCGC14_2157790 [marine sediment metagenome]|uniref:Lipoprotein n=1 Tax=marine sediment metagenome TaxID=412755 RepID=A0A0F9DTU2_9ZZZZ
MRWVLIIVLVSVLLAACSGDQQQQQPEKSWVEYNACVESRPKYGPGFPLQPVSQELVDMWCGRFKP